MVILHYVSPCELHYYQKGWSLCKPKLCINHIRNNKSLTTELHFVKHKQLLQQSLSGVSAHSRFLGSVNSLCSSAHPLISQERSATISLPLTLFKYPMSRSALDHFLSLFPSFPFWRWWGLEL